MKKIISLVCFLYLISTCSVMAMDQNEEESNSNLSKYYAIKNELQKNFTSQNLDNLNYTKDEKNTNDVEKRIYSLTPESGVLSLDSMSSQESETGHITYYEKEPNNSIQTANIVNNNYYGQNYYSIYGTITDYYFDLDYFRFDVTKSGTFNILGMWAGKYLGYGWESDLGIGLLDSNGVVISAAILIGSYPDTYKHLLKSVSPGRYYIVVLNMSDYQYLYVGEKYYLAVKFTPDTGQFTISLTSNPVQGGSVSGGGIFEDGQQITVKATPNKGYEFVSWTEDGQKVSTNANYTFTVSSDRDLIANFAMSVGSLKVNIEPQEAVESGAQWRRKGTNTWYDSGFTETNVPIGNYSVEFRIVPGWRPAGTINVTVQANKTTTGTGLYLEQASVLPGVLMLLLEDEE